MSRKVVGIIVCVLGAALVFVSLAADVIGLGGQAGMGWKQISGTVVGVVVLLVGGWLALGKKSQAKK